MRFRLAINVKIAGKVRSAGSDVDLRELIADEATRAEVARQIVASRFGTPLADPPPPAPAPVSDHSQTQEPLSSAETARPVGKRAKRAKG